MLLYLLRHADADTVAATDDARPLSPKGHRQGEALAEFCVKHGVQPAVILSSPLPRARETAEYVAKATNTELEIHPWIACGMNPERAVEELKEYRTRTSAMLVGHEPDLSTLVAYLLALPSNSQVNVRKASLTALELPVYRAGAGRLEFSIPCKMM